LGTCRGCIPARWRRQSLSMATAKHSAVSAFRGGGQRSFSPGIVAVVSLTNPREKFWGAILELSAAGLSIRGIDLNSFDDYVSLVRAGDACGPCEVFFPMHRVERIEADLSTSGIPSVGERFFTATGKPVSALFGKNQPRSVPRR